MQIKRIILDDRVEYRLNGKPHREDAPAIERANGDKEWMLNGKRHREDGPAIEFANGYREWWLNGKLHREDGPAIERTNGGKEWWVNNQEYSEEEFNDLIEDQSSLETRAEDISQAITLPGEQQIKAVRMK